MQVAFWKEDTMLAIVWEMAAQGRECLIAKAGYQVLLFGPASTPAEVACLPARH